MAYGLKFYFEDKKIVTSTAYTYRFEILQDGYSGSSTAKLMLFLYPNDLGLV